MNSEREAYLCAGNPLDLRISVLLFISTLIKKRAVGAGVYTCRPGKMGVECYYLATGIQLQEQEGISQSGIPT